MVSELRSPRLIAMISSKTDPDSSKHAEPESERKRFVPNGMKPELVWVVVVVGTGVTKVVGIRSWLEIIWRKQEIQVGCAEMACSKALSPRRGDPKVIQMGRFDVFT